MWTLSKLSVGYLEARKTGGMVPAMSSMDIISDIPNSYYSSMNSPQDVDRAIETLQIKNLVKPYGDSIQINKDGVFFFRKFLEPIITAMGDKNKFKDLIENLEGSEEVRNQLKDLPKKLGGVIATQGVNALIDVTIEYGSDAIYYIIELGKKLIGV